MCKYIQDLAAVWCKPWLHIRIHPREDPAWMLIRSTLIQQDSHSLTINEDIINWDTPHTGRRIFLTQPERRPPKRTGFNSERTMCLHLHRKNFYEPLNSDVWLNTNEFQLPVERYIFALVSVIVCVCVHCVYEHKRAASHYCEFSTLFFMCKFYWTNRAQQGSQYVLIFECGENYSPQQKNLSFAIIRCIPSGGCGTKQPSYEISYFIRLACLASYCDSEWN